METDEPTLADVTDRSDRRAMGRLISVSGMIKLDVSKQRELHQGLYDVRYIDLERSMHQICLVRVQEGLLVV